MRQTFAIATGKTLLEILHRTGRGGTAFPGLVATRIAPHILRDLTGRLPGGSAMVIGTNGKTTTTRLFATILETAGIKVANNRSGSNLIRGKKANQLGRFARFSDAFEPSVDVHMHLQVGCRDARAGRIGADILLAEQRFQVGI